MYDFEALIGELLQNRPELNRDEVMRRIEDKKRTVGAGYLTNQGALFLVAGELGVSLRKEDASSDMTIKDLYIAAHDVTVVVRIVALTRSPPTTRKTVGRGSIVESCSSTARTRPGSRSGKRGSSRRANSGSRSIRWLEWLTPTSN